MKITVQQTRAMAKLLRGPRDLGGTDRAEREVYRRLEKKGFVYVTAGRFASLTTEGRACMTPSNG